MNVSQYAIATMGSLFWTTILLEFISFAVSQGEFCDYETFQVQCLPGEIFQVLSAEYGHMKIGKCVETNLGHFGCRADVTRIIAARCDGKQRCEINVLDPEIRDTQPCAKGVEEYLDVTYACLKGL